MIVYIFWNLSTESREALTGSASGLKRLRRWATSYITFHQIVRAVDRTWYPWIQVTLLQHVPFCHCSLAFSVVAQVSLWFDVTCGSTWTLNRQRFGLKRSEEETIG